MQPFLNSSVNPKTFRDVDSQADRYRNNIRQLEKLQMSALSPSAMQSVVHRPGTLFPEPHREHPFNRNTKTDGIAYADAKTKARRFELNKISQPYNANR